MHVLDESQELSAPGKCGIGPVKFGTKIGRFSDIFTPGALNI